MGKPPSTSRKDLRTSAPYRRTRDTAPPGAAPLGKIQLVQAPAPVAPAPVALASVAPAPVAPASVAPAPVAPAPVAVALDLPMPVAAAPAAPSAAPARSDRLAALNTSLGFAAAALTALPHPAELVVGDPAAPEPPPGAAPAGDARSLRAGDQFALVYRHGAAVVSRRGKLGQRGAWRVVDYPSPALAAHAYALECSRLVGQGFRDVT